MLKLLDFDISMLSNTITLFTPYATIDSRDEKYIKEYKDYFIPTIIDNVYYETSKNYTPNNNGNVDIGNYGLVISLKQSKAYRYIDKEKIIEHKRYVDFIDNVEYTNKSYNEQAYLYWTVKPTDCYFILGTIEEYKYTVKIHKSEIATSTQALLSKGKQRHHISNIDKGGVSFILSISGSV